LKKSSKKLLSTVGLGAEGAHALIKPPIRQGLCHLRGLRERSFFCRPAARFFFVHKKEVLTVLPLTRACVVRPLHVTLLRRAGFRIIAGVMNDCDFVTGEKLMKTSPLLHVLPQKSAIRGRVAR
jgi:hypothetical protein